MMATVPRSTDIPSRVEAQAMREARRLGERLAALQRPEVRTPRLLAAARAAGLRFLRDQRGRPPMAGGRP